MFGGGRDRKGFGCCCGKRSTMPSWLIASASSITSPRIPNAMCVVLRRSLFYTASGIVRGRLPCGFSSEVIVSTLSSLIWFGLLDCAGTSEVMNGTPAIGIGFWFLEITKRRRLEPQDLFGAKHDPLYQHYDCGGQNSPHTFHAHHYCYLGKDPSGIHCPQLWRFRCWL